MNPSDEKGRCDGCGKSACYGMAPRKIVYLLQPETQSKPGKNRMGNAAGDKSNSFNDNKGTDDSTGNRCEQAKSNQQGRARLRDKPDLIPQVRLVGPFASGKCSTTPSGKN